jgi:hypothetical protein
LARDLRKDVSRLTHTAMPQTLTARPTALAALLAGYVAGDVTDDAMARFDDLFEDASASAQERLAFARFYLDVLAAGDDKEAIPHPSEVGGILSAIRA